MILVLPIFISVAAVSSGPNIQHDNMMLIHPATWLSVFFIFGIPALIMALVLFMTKNNRTYSFFVKSLPISLPLVSFFILILSLPFGATIAIIATIGIFLIKMVVAALFILGFIVIWTDKNA